MRECRMQTNRDCRTQTSRECTTQTDRESERYKEMGRDTETLRETEAGKNREQREGGKEKGKGIFMASVIFLWRLFSFRY